MLDLITAIRRELALNPTCMLKRIYIPAEKFSLLPHWARGKQKETGSSKHAGNYNICNEIRRISLHHQLYGCCWINVVFVSQSFVGHLKHFGLLWQLFFTKFSKDQITLKVAILTSKFVLQVTVCKSILKQYWIMKQCSTSGGSRIFPGGGANSQSGCANLFFRPKTAWKWKNLDPGGRPWRPP